MHQAPAHTLADELQSAARALVRAVAACDGTSCLHGFHEDVLEIQVELHRIREDLDRKRFKAHLRTRDSFTRQV